jgi:hypothetical protein
MNIFPSDMRTLSFMVVVCSLTHLISCVSQVVDWSNGKAIVGEKESEILRLVRQT